MSVTGVVTNGIWNKRVQTLPEEAIHTLAATNIIINILFSLYSYTCFSHFPSSDKKEPTCGKVQHCQCQSQDTTSRFSMYCPPSKPVSLHFITWEKIFLCPYYKAASQTLRVRFNGLVLFYCNTCLTELRINAWPVKSIMMASSTFFIFQTIVFQVIPPSKFSMYSLSPPSQPHHHAILPF